MRRAAAAATSVLVLVMIAPACQGDQSQAHEIPNVVIDPSSDSPTDRAIADALTRLQRDENDDDARYSLAAAFLQKVRETADPTLYPKAQGLLDDLAARHDEDPRVLAAQGTLALAQHRFEDALDLGQRTLRLSPHNATAYGILVDSYNELGRYDDALRATDDMVNARPDVASYARVSYARELRGDYPGAIEAMTQAATAADAHGGENLAYVQTLLGQLLLTTGDLDNADKAYEAALAAFPGFTAARAGRAQVLVARGNYTAAADILAEVVKVQPLVQYAVAEGDALTAAGRRDDARDAYDLVDVIAKLFTANGVQLDLEIALFDADHHPGPDAVARARRALKARPSGLAHDVLAWNLYRVNELDEAARESGRALALGSRDPQEQFHAAAIAFARMDRARAIDHMRVVLATNPRFSARFVADVARLAHELGLSVPLA